MEVSTVMIHLLDEATAAFEFEYSSCHVAVVSIAISISSSGNIVKPWRMSEMEKRETFHSVSAEGGYKPPQPIV